MNRSLRVFVCALPCAAAFAVQAGVGKMDATPIWDLADHGGARAVSRTNTLQIPWEDISAQFDSKAFTIEAKVTFGTMTDRHSFAVFNQIQSDTGWGLDVSRLQSSSSPMQLECNGNCYFCSYALGSVADNSTHVFTLTARDGWIVTYMNGKVQRSFTMVASPNQIPITVGGPTMNGLPGLEGVTVQSLKLWDGTEKFYASGESASPATGFEGGDGWLVEKPTPPIEGKPNVLYVGDSISDGYTAPFKQVTKGRANLYHWNNCWSTAGAAGVKAKPIQEVCAVASLDKIVFNNGLHSLTWTEDKVTDAAVKESYATLVDTFRAAAPNATVYYLATTPYTAAKNEQGVVEGYGDKNPVVLRLNRLAREVMTEKNVPYIDAYALFEDRFELARGDQFHWNSAAYQELATLVMNGADLAFKITDCAAGDDVSLPSGTVMTFRDEDGPTLDAFNSLTILSGAQVTFDLTNGIDLASVVVTNAGTIVKTGPGPLAVSSKKPYGPAGSIDLREGEFVCPQNMDNNSEIFMGSVTMAKGTTFVTGLSPAGNNGNTTLYGLNGWGVVTNRGTGSLCQLRVNYHSSYTKGESTFAGQIVSKGIRFYSNANVNLVGTNNTYSGGTEMNGGFDRPDLRGMLGVALFGMKGAGKASSVNPSGGIAIREHGGGIRYLGTGETTDREISYWNNSTGDGIYLDAGATGGVTFTGTFSHNRDTRLCTIVFMGSNTAPCTVKGPWLYETETSAAYLIKRGTGTWHFADNASRQNMGIVAVEEGTLAFDSIAESNCVCSLGLATCRKEPFKPDYASAKTLDYAILLGGGKTRGVFEYRGAGDCTCATRPIAVKDGGEIRLAEGCGKLTLSGVKAAPGAAGALVLSGAAGTFGTLRETADGAGGALSLAKEGAGTWRLAGKHEFSGALAVKEGVLEVQGAQTNAYSWYRFNVAGTGTGHGWSDDANVTFRGFRFYDADGNAITTKDTMTCKLSHEVGVGGTGTAYDWTKLLPGEYSWGRTGTYSYYETRDIDLLFDLNMNGSRICVCWKGITPVLANPSSWWPIVIRLPEDAAAVARFDVASGFDPHGSRTLTEWTLEGSCDAGTNWTEVLRYEYDEDTIPNNGYWYADYHTASNKYADATKDVARPGQGYVVDNSYRIADCHALANVTGANVAPGATLRAIGHVELPAVTLDCTAGAGAIEGFALAADGKVDVKGAAAEGRVVLPNPFVDCTGVENLATWTLTVDGAPVQDRKLYVHGDALVLAPPGSALIVR